MKEEGIIYLEGVMSDGIKKFINNTLQVFVLTCWVSRCNDIYVALLGII